MNKTQKFAIAKGFIRLYKEIRGDDTLANEIFEQTANSLVYDPKVGHERYLKEIVREDTIKTYVDDFLKSTVQGRAGRYLDRASSIIDIYDDTGEGLEVILEGAALYTGPGAAAVGAIANAGMLPIDALVHGAYAVIDLVNGNRAGIYDGFDDTYKKSLGKNIAGVVTKQIPAVGSALEFFTHWDDRRPLLVDSFSKQARQHLLDNYLTDLAKKDLEHRLYGKDGVGVKIPYEQSRALGDQYVYAPDMVPVQQTNYPALPLAV